MLGLIGMEFRKIIEKKLVIVGIFLVIILNHMMYDGWLGSQEVMRPDGSYAQGMEAIHLDQEIAGRYEGLLSDAMVQQVLKDFELPEDFNGADYPVGYIVRNNIYQSISQFRDENGNYNGKLIEEVYGENAGNLFVGYNKSWVSILYYMSYLMIMGIAYLIIVSVAPVFSEEYSSGMDALILTSRYGRTKCAWAKVIAALCYTLIITGVCIAVNFGNMLARFGIQGWNGSLQFNYQSWLMGVPYEIHFLQACVYAVGIWIGAGMLLTGMSLIVSAFSRSNFVALVILAFIYTVPLFFNATTALGCMLLSVFPIQQLQLAAPFEVPLLNIMGREVPFQVMVILYSVIAAVLFLAIARKIFAVHEVKE